MLATGRNFAMIAGVENVMPAIAADRDLSAKHHDPRIEIMRVQVFGEVGLLSPVHDFEPFAPQVAFEGLAGERTSVPAPPGQQGDALDADMLGVHAAGRHFEALPRAEGDGSVVAGDGDFAAQDQGLGVEIMAVIGGYMVRLHTGVNGGAKTGHLAA